MFRYQQLSEATIHGLGAQKSFCELQDAQPEDYNAFLIIVTGIGPVYQG